MTKATRATGNSRTKDRPERIPVSGHRNIMTVHDQDPAFVYRWVNDVEDRIEIFKLGGWKLVEDKHQVGDRSVNSGTQLDKVVTKNVGAGRTSYLMKIEREFYEEDQAAKERAIAEKERSMLASERNAEGRYGSVTIK
jgi:hypothetical protein